MRMVSFDSRELKKLQRELEKLQKNTNAFAEECAKELAARLLAKVIKRTPVGEYDKTGKKGGTLRRGWKTAEENMTVKKQGSNYIITIANTVEYAPYVEFGHRTPSHNGWVPGHFMMTISEQEIKNAAPGILEQRINKWLGEVFK